MNEMATKDFSIKELSCPCCQAYDMQSEFLVKLQELRDLYAKPMSITSAFRCEKHNIFVNGHQHSSHLEGLAVDVFCKESATRYQLIKLAQQVGFKGIGIHSFFLHIDLRKIGENVVFLYQN